MDRFVKESSLHGIPTIFNRSEDKIARFFTALACLIAFGGLGFYVHGIYVKVVVMPETVEEVNLIPSTEVPFPAVTICSPLFSKNNSPNIREVLKNPDLILTKLEQDSLSVNIQACRPSLSSSFLHMCKNRNVSNILNILSEKSKIFGLCISPINSYIENCEKILKFVLTNQGYCHTYNMLDNIIDDKNHQWTVESSYRSSNNSSNLVRANEGTFFSVYPSLLKNDLNNFCEFGKKFKIFLHDPNEIVTPFHKPLYVRIGHAKKIFLRIKFYKKSLDMKKFEPKARQCYFEDERKLKFFNVYTENHCLFECLTNLTLKNCGCVRFSMPRDDDTKICDLNETICTVDVMKNMSKNEFSKCNCLKSCYHMEYEVDSVYRTDRVTEPIIKAFSSNE